jgi:hypothetical protein
MDLDRLTVEAQSVLDDLWAENLIPFQLTAHKVDSIGLEEYIVRFYDRRLHSVDVSWKNLHSFKDAVRVAILNRVARLGGPSKARPKKTRSPDPKGIIDKGICVLISALHALCAISPQAGI